MKSFLPLLLVSFAVFTACESSTSPTEQILTYEQVTDYSVNHILEVLPEIPENNYPIITDASGKWILTQPSEWTSGFYPGCLWYAYKLNPDTLLFNAAISFTEGLEEQQYNTDHHDVGFMILNSYGHAYEITENEEYKNVIIQAANSLSTRYNATVGCIQSWNGDFQVIIDNMMNLEILFWAAKNGGGNNLYDIAVSHAYKTMQNHVRENGSCYQLVQYDPNTGDVIDRRNVQGYSDSSTWSRGEAWGVYGFTMCYRETGDENFLRTAEKMADYFIDNLPGDYVPYWDFELPPDETRKFKDASAAAIALSGLLELRNYSENAEKYDAAIENIFLSLTKNYLSINDNSNGILLHGAYNANSSDPVNWDASTIWGDYYFMEALERYEDFN